MESNGEREYLKTLALLINILKLKYFQSPQNSHEPYYETAPRFVWKL